MRVDDKQMFPSRRALTCVPLGASLLLAACRPPHWETARELQPAASAWAGRSGLALDDAATLTRLVVDTRVLGLGEAAHGSRDVFLVQADVTKRLIEMGWVRAIVLENGAWETCVVDGYLRGETDDSSVLTRYTIGLYQHPDATAFFEWLRERNLSAAEPVRVFGMDMQYQGACTEARAGCPRRAELCEQSKALQRHWALGATGYNLRDEFMAKNILHVARDVGGGVVVWVHSAHATKTADLLPNGHRKQSAPMGWYLQAELGRTYVAVNVTFLAGGVSSANSGGRLFKRARSPPPQEDFWLAPAPALTLEGALTSEVARVYQLRSLPPGSEAAAWFSKPHFRRVIGANLSGWRAKNGSWFVGWAKTVPREAYDAIIVVPHSTPIQPYWAPRTRKKGARGARAGDPG